MSGNIRRLVVPSQPEPPEEVSQRSELEVLIELSHHRLLRGSSILDAPDSPRAVWGDGQRCLWAQGEPLILVGGDGVGKTTVAQQLALLRSGVTAGDFLGLPVAIADRPVLYLACDRPSQALRSFRRMVNPDMRRHLDDWLKLWHGPIPFDLGRQPEGLLALAIEAGAGTVFVDGLKDVAGKLTDDEVGGSVNRAFQHCVAEGIEVCVLHHQRKAQAGGGRLRQLADVYGSRWITAGAGSVVGLWGDPGDLIVDFDHLKQPAEQVGPHRVRHDHSTGASYLVDAVDPLVLVQEADGNGVTVQAVAMAVYRNPTPDRPQVEKARRILERLCTEGHIAKRAGARGGPASEKIPTTYHAI